MDGLFPDSSSTVFSCVECSVLLDGHNLVEGQCLEVCGDGLKTDHECDDHNLINGDGCDVSCQVEDSWECTQQPNGTDTCLPSAGPDCQIHSLDEEAVLQVVCSEIVQIDSLTSSDIGVSISGN